jgi:adenylyltransferase/sulfurtransferase
MMVAGFDISVKLVVDSAMIQEINPIDAAAMRSQSSHALFLDVREAPELAICHIEGALHIAMSELTSQLAAIPQDRPVIVLCHHGMRSRQVIQFLQTQGYDKLLNLEGGIHAWAHEVDPEMTTY